MFFRNFFKPINHDNNEKQPLLNNNNINNKDTILNIDSPSKSKLRNQQIDEYEKRIKIISTEIRWLKQVKPRWTSEQYQSLMLGIASLLLVGASIYGFFPVSEEVSENEKEVTEDYDNTLDEDTNTTCGESFPVDDICDGYYDYEFDENGKPNDTFCDEMARYFCDIVKDSQQLYALPVTGILVGVIGSLAFCILCLREASYRERLKLDQTKIDLLSHAAQQRINTFFEQYKFANLSAINAETTLSELIDVLMQEKKILKKQVKPLKGLSEQLDPYYAFSSVKQSYKNSSLGQRFFDNKDMMKLIRNQLVDFDKVDELKSRIGVNSNNQN